VKITANPVKPIPKAAVPQPPKPAVTSSPVSSKTPATVAPSTKADANAKVIPINPLPASKELSEGTKAEVSPTGSWASLAQKQPQTTPQKSSNESAPQLSPPPVSQPPPVSPTPMKVEIAPTKLDGAIGALDAPAERKDPPPPVVIQNVEYAPQPAFPRLNGDLGVRLLNRH
jgi:hypothetical protein